MNKVDIFEQKASTIEETMKTTQTIPISQVEEIIVDYVFRCIKGIYSGKFIYINLTPEGEVFGSDPEADLTLYIENSGLSPKHADIKYDYNEKKYYLKDLESERGIWMKVRNESPMFIRDNTIFKIGNELFQINYEKENFDILLEWLMRIELSKLYDYFKNQNMRNFEDILNIREEEIRKLDLNEIERENLISAIAEIPEDFKGDYVAKKLVLKDFKSKEPMLRISWAGAYIGNFENADLVLNTKANKGNAPFEDEETIEVAIKYQQGNYWLVTSKQNTAEVFSKLNKNDVYILHPDDIYRMGDLDFLVQRFNTGCHSDKGSRHHMEDVIVVRQQLGVSAKLDVSFFAVFDGHGGSDCVSYVAENLVENLRNNFLADDNFDKQENFFGYVQSILEKSIKETDKGFLDEFPDVALKTGCAALIVLIIGDYIFCVNLGDSRAILSRKGKAVWLSIDHKPGTSAEKSRIEASGGHVYGNRVGGFLGVSRAFGDFEYKPITRGDKTGKYNQDIVVSLPDIRIWKIDYLQDEFIMMGSDGLFDVYTNEKIVDFIRNKLVSMPLMEQDPQAVAIDLINTAHQDSIKKYKQCDNISCIIITFTRGLEKLNE